MDNTHTTLVSLFTDIADAIRSKTKSTEAIVADEFHAAIRALENNKVWVGLVTVQAKCTSITVECGFKPTSCVGGVFGDRFYEGIVSLAYDGMAAWIQYLEEEEGDDSQGGRAVTVTLSDTGVTFTGWNDSLCTGSNDLLVICVG